MNELGELRRRGDWATWALLLIYAAGCALALPDQGSSWDEDAHRLYARWIFEWFGTGDPHSPALTHPSQPTYGGFFPVAASYLERIFPRVYFTHVRHAATAITGMLGLIFTARAGRVLGGPWCGFLAALLLATMPQWFGHSLFNPVDIPFGGLFAVAMFYLLGVLQALPRPNWRAWIKLAAATGLAAGARIGAVLIIFYLGLGLACWLALEILTRWRTGAPRAAWRALAEHAPGFLAGMVVCVVGAYLAAAATWPFLMVNPRNVLKAMGLSANFPWNAPVLFGEQLRTPSELVPVYIPTWFAITTPLPVIGGIGAALVLATRLVRARGREARLALGVVLLAVIFPPAYAVFNNSWVYDGIRHFLFVMPAMALLAALGWQATIEAASRVRWLRGTAIAALTLMVIEPVAWYVRAHPYQYVYFNPLVGGLGRASHRFETEYWGLSMRAAAEWLERHRADFGTDRLVVRTVEVPWHTLIPWIEEPLKTHLTRDPNEPCHAILEFFRGRQPGWEKNGEAIYEEKVVEGQVPFWRVLPGPLAPGSFRAADPP